MVMQAVVYGFCGWWAWHRQAYLEGRVSRPFFGAGSKSKPKTRPSTVRSRSAPSGATPPKPAQRVDMPGGVTVIGGRAAYRKTRPAAPLQPDAVSWKTTPTPPAEPSTTIEFEASPSASPSASSQANPNQPPPPSIMPLPKTSTRPRPIELPRMTLDVPTALLLRLDRYTYDREISNRLVLKVAHNNPGKNGRWCAEKALWDIERDRY